MSGCGFVWKIIWSLGIPNNAKVFLWRACNEILPTKANLKKRVVLLEDVCKFCKQEVKTVTHALWDCPAAQDVWGAGDRKIQKSPCVRDNFMAVMEYLMERYEDENLEVFALIAKGIWQRRNYVLYGKEFSHPNKIVYAAGDLLQQYQLANKKSQSDEVICEVSRQWWRPPMLGAYKVNWDVGINSRLPCMGVGVVIRDHLGQGCAAQSKSIKGAFEPSTTEAIAACHAVDLCKDLGLHLVELKGDSMIIVKAITSMELNGASYGHIVEDIKEVLRTLKSWTIHHVPREAKHAAHGLAKVATKKEEDKIWFEEVRDSIFDVITLELNALCL